jgi:hypothetical protein
LRTVPARSRIVGTHLQKVGDLGGAAGEQRQQRKRRRQRPQHHQEVVMTPGQVGLFVREHRSEL